MMKAPPIHHYCLCSNAYVSILWNSKTVFVKGLRVMVVECMGFVCVCSLAYDLCDVMCA